ncbi:sugar ABC transporter permease [Blautia schinkii]|nr:sugar ABC transporter permease [Blautia schinkii]
MKRRKKKRGLQDTSKMFYLFISPWIVGFCVFTFFPMIFSFVTSFTNWSGLDFPTKFGFDNYRQIFTADNSFWTALKNTFYYVGVSVPLNTAVSVGLAMLLNKRLPGTNFFRAVFYLPTICTGVALYIAWMYLYNGDTGFINVLLAKIGIEGPRWLTSYTMAMPSIILMDMFACGTSMTIVLAGLQDIPSTYYEAAELDGANALRKFRHITFPMLSPVIFFNVLMAIIKGVQIFTQPYVMTEGGPARATFVYGLYLYNTAFSYVKFGYASALAWILFAILIIVSLIIFGTSKFWVFYREDVN